MFSVIVLTERTFASRGKRITLPRPAKRRAEPPAVAARRAAWPSRRGIGSGAELRPARARGRRLHLRPAADRLERPGRHLLQADDVGVAGGDQLDHLAQVAARARRERVAAVEVPGADEHRALL